MTQRWMWIKWLLIWILAITPVFAGTIYRPFGAIQWDDSFTTAVRKILSIPGIEKCQVKFVLNTMDLSDKDINSIESIPDQLLRPPAKNLIEAVMPTIYQTDVFTDGNGVQYKYIKETYNISAYPVMICGVPFKLTAVFKSNPGLLLLNRGYVLKTKQGLFVPLVLQQMSLHSDSKALVHKSQEITNVLSNKYFGGKMMKVGFTTSKKDSVGTYLTIHATTSNYQITYGGTYGSAYFQYVSKTYEEYLSRMALINNQGKKDMSSGL